MHWLSYLTVCSLHCSDIGNVPCQAGNSRFSTTFIQPAELHVSDSKPLSSGLMRRRIFPYTAEDKKNKLKILKVAKLRKDDEGLINYYEG